MSTRILMVYKRFERAWHWSQVALIMTLLFSGFAVRGIHHLIDFRTAVVVHTAAALALLVIWAFATFWLFTTGDYKHYLPSKEGMFAVIRYYTLGIFMNEEHPYHKVFWRKHNPLQAMSYLFLKVILFPGIWISGLAYLTYGFWHAGPIANSPLWLLADIHVAAAYAILAFVIIHVYLLTTGHSFIAHVRPMITGYDEVELTEAEEAYLAESKMVPMK